MDVWRPLILRAIARLEQIGLSQRDWIWGGGTVLMLRHQHRMSRDVDIFLRDIQHLSFLSPRLDDRGTSGMLGYVEQANHLRLEYSEGEIDFLVVAPVFPHLDAELMTIEGVGQELQVMRDKEILAQKLYYRAAGFTGRDLYDFVCVMRADPALRRDEELRGVAKLRADALEASLASPRCEAGYSRVDERSIELPFADARADLLDWLKRPKP